MTGRSRPRGRADTAHRSQARAPAIPTPSDACAAAAEQRNYYYVACGYETGFARRHVRVGQPDLLAGYRGAERQPAQQPSEQQRFVRFFHRFRVPRLFPHSVRDQRGRKQHDEGYGKTRAVERERADVFRGLVLRDERYAEYECRKGKEYGVFRFHFVFRSLLYSFCLRVSMRRVRGNSTKCAARRLFACAFARNVVQWSG